MIKDDSQQAYSKEWALNFLSALDALGVKLVDSKFFAALDDFYKQELIKIHREQSLPKNIQIAS